MNEYILYKAFDEGHYIHQASLCKVANYIYANLISWSPNRSFWEAEYNYVTKLMIVCNWKQKRGLRLMAKKGEAICNDELANLIQTRNIKGVFVQQFKNIIWGID